MASANTNIETFIDFIADLRLYEEEKPYFLHPSASAVNPEAIVTTNVEWDKKRVTVRSMRDKGSISLEENGFCYVEHQSRCIPGTGVDSDGVKRYCKEGEEMLQSLVNAEFVRCYDYKVRDFSSFTREDLLPANRSFKMRKNVPMTKEAYDPDDQFLVEAAAIGAHGKTSRSSSLLLQPNISQLVRDFDYGDCWSPVHLFCTRYLHRHGSRTPSGDSHRVRDEDLLAAWLSLSADKVRST